MQKPVKKKKTKLNTMRSTKKKENIFISNEQTKKNANSIFRKVVLVLFLMFISWWIPYQKLMQTQQELDDLKDQFIQYKSETGEVDKYLTEIDKERNQRISLHQEVKCLAQNIYFESAKEPYEGQLAVATVTVNRKNNPKYPKTVCGVVYQQNNGRCQFTWVCENKGHPPNDPYFKKSLALAKDVLIHNKKSRIIGTNVIFYHANYIKPDWPFYKLKREALIGTHIFYSEK